MKEQKFSALAKLGFVAFFLLFTVLPAYALFGGKIERFSAEQVAIEPGGNPSVIGKIYAMLGMYRSETTVEKGGKTLVSIFRKDRT